MSALRLAVVGVGVFGKNHLRVIRDNPGAHLAGVFDIDPGKAHAAAQQYGCPVFSALDDLRGNVDAAIIATPTHTHADVGCRLLEHGIHLLVEKPIAADLESARRLEAAAAQSGRILQVGHLERFNPAVQALQGLLTTPLFFEIHRLSVFTPRSLDVDVVLDLMIHDIDLVLDLTGMAPCEVRAAGISILSPKVDIANARLAFPSGCIANLTASRVSTERIRKLRLFQPHEYISLDYDRQDGAVFSVDADRRIGFRRLNIEKAEPLRQQLDAFLSAITCGSHPQVGARQAVRALEVALDILGKIEEHRQLVAHTLASSGSRARHEADGNTPDDSAA